MTHTVSLLADHKGFVKPRANGDEYMVDAVIDITEYNNAAGGGNVITASSLGLSSITSAYITGQENLTYTGVIMCAAETGLYESNDSFNLLVQQLLQATPAEETDADTTTYSFRVRVHGQL